MEMERSMAFLTRVKNVFRKQGRWKYDELLRLLQAFRAGDFDLQGTVLQINMLFADHQDILSAFAEFLPPDLRCSSSNSPQPPPSEAPPPAQFNGDGALDLQADPNIAPLNFIMQIKNRFSSSSSSQNTAAAAGDNGQVDVYRSIARSLTKYSEGKKSLHSVIVKIKYLLREHPDLISQFQELFLASPPATKEMAAPTTGNSNGNGAPPPSTSETPTNNRARPSSSSKFVDDGHGHGRARSVKKRPAAAAAAAAEAEAEAIERPTKKRRKKKSDDVACGKNEKTEMTSVVLRDPENRERRPEEWGPSYRAAAVETGSLPLAASPVLNEELESKDALCYKGDDPLRKLTASEEEYFKMEKEMLESEMMEASLDAVIDHLENKSDEHEHEHHHHPHPNDEVVLLRKIKRHLKRIYGSASKASKKLNELIENKKNNKAASLILSQLKKKKELLIIRREDKSKQQENNKTTTTTTKKKKKKNNKKKKKKKKKKKN